ncbi:MAG: TolC family protein [Bacteroidia bacterium]|nr:TolC family protein [Bacteroidia bacterium]
MNRISQCIFLIFGLCTPLLGQQSLSLEEALEIGISNSIDVEIAKINQRIATNNNTLKAAGQHPTITASLTNSNVLLSQNNPASFIGDARILSNSIDGNVDVAVSIYDGNRIQINKSIFELQQALSNLGVDQSIEQVILNVLSAYYQAQIQKEQLQTFDEVLKLSEDRIEYQEIRKEFGQSGTFDLLQSQDALLNDSTNYLVTLNNYKTAIRSLKLAMGDIDSETDYDVSDPLDFDPKIYRENELVSRSADRNFTLQSLKVNEKIAISQINFQKSFRKPTLSLNGGVNLGLVGTDLSGSIPGTNEPFTYTLGNSYGPYVNLAARYTISDGGNINRSVENAELEARIAQLDIQNQKRNLTIQVQNALAEYNNQLNLIALAENLLDNARNNLQIAEERFKAAQINSFDYRSIQLSYINANLTRLSAIFNLKMSGMEIERLTGDLVNYQ